MSAKLVLSTYLCVFLIELSMYPVYSLTQQEFNGFKGTIHPDTLSIEVQKKIANSICVKTNKIKQGVQTTFINNTPSIDKIKIQFSDGSIGDVTVTLIRCDIDSPGQPTIHFDFGTGQTSDGLYLYTCENYSIGRICTGEHNVQGPFPTS